MSCGNDQEKLNSFVDGFLTGIEMKAIEDHMEDCDLCREGVRRIREVREAVKALTRIDPGESFKGAVLERISRTGMKPSLFDAIASSIPEFTFRLLRAPAFYGIIIICIFLRILSPPQVDEHGDYVCLTKPAFVSAVCKYGPVADFVPRPEFYEPEPGEMMERKEIQYDFDTEDSFNRIAIRPSIRSSCPVCPGSSLLGIYF